MLRAILLLMAALAAAPATDVPVFRYALERWDPSPHAIELRLPEDQARQIQDELSRLRAPVDVSLAAVTVRMPHGAVWYEGPFRPGLAEALADSPARRALADALVAGASAVWIIVDDGGPGIAAAEARLRTRLDYLSSIMQLPTPPEDQDGSRSLRRLDLPHIPVRIDFRIQRIRHDDPVEAVFLRQLAAVGTAATGPAFAVPVFGRGRALDRLPPAGITDPAVDDISQFLLGACSCQVKDLNPGEDLLMDIDWYGRLTEEPAATLPATAPAAPAVQAPAVPDTVIIRSPAAVTGPAAGPTREWTWVLILSTLAVGIAAVFAMRGRPGRK
ncbi:MAG: hypothetical protein RLZZ127_2806 [Planctomycetota bacterium]|jgi:hypothetical protein